MENKLILIWGPESSGTRLIKKTLLLNGYLGSEGHDESWGQHPTTYQLPPVGELNAIPVWRFSFPMGGHFPDAENLLDYITNQGYQPKVIVTTRDMHAQALSARFKRSGHRHVVATGYGRIFTAISRSQADFWVLSYESLIQRGLPVLQAIPFLNVDRIPKLRDANERYYASESVV